MKKIRNQDNNNLYCRFMCKFKCVAYQKLAERYFFIKNFYQTVKRSKFKETFFNFHFYFISLSFYLKLS